MTQKRQLRNLIIDAGAERGVFAEELKRRHPKHEVIAFGRAPKSPKVRKNTIGGFFLELNEQDAKRLHAVWINHVNITESSAHREFIELVRCLPKKVPVILTVRRQNLEATRHAIELAGLKIKSEKPYTPKLAGSATTKEFYQQAQRGSEEVRPWRIIAIKSS